MRRHGYSRSMVELIEFKEEERTSDRFEQGISGKKIPETRSEVRLAIGKGIGMTMTHALLLMVR